MRSDSGHDRADRLLATSASGAIALASGVGTEHGAQFGGADIDGHVGLAGRSVVGLQTPEICGVVG